MAAGIKTGVLALVLTLAIGGSAAAQEDGVIGPYDGQIPFNCQLQNVGTGTAFPDPEADPFCVEFDKTNQNVTDFGIADFALQEPTRVLAAVTTCFYFQRDHWTGSIVQGQAPELWHWDGDYWFDIARGVGGVSVRNLRLGGVALDATPFVPPAYRPYFDPDGGGGVMVELATNPPSHCTSRVDTPEERDQVYGRRPAFMDCIEPGGELHGRRVGAVALGMSRAAVAGKLGIPHDHSRGVDRWCVVGKGGLRVAYGGARERTAVIQTSSRGHSARGVARGDGARRAHRRLELERLFKLGSTRVFEARSAGQRRLLVAIAGHRVRWLALARLGTAPLERILERMR